MINKKIILYGLALFSIIYFISLGLYCASENGYLPTVHGPYYFAVAKSLFHYGEINFYAVYPPLKSLVYTLQIGISFIEYLVFFITEKHWYLVFYAITSLVWVFAFFEFLKFENKNINEIDKYILFFVFFFQPYNLNQIANFSNEAFYFPILIYFYFSFYRFSISKKFNILYIIVFSIFIFIGIYFRLHHAIVCLNFFVFSLFLKDKKISFGLILLGIINIVIFYLMITYTNLNSIFADHLTYLNKSMSLEEFFIVFFDKFFLITSYPILIEKFTSNQFVYYFFGITFFIILVFGFFINQKKNKRFNVYNLSYFLLSTIFVIFLPPFEYSYILPFSFVIFFYGFIVFKNLFKKNYVKVFCYLILTFAIILPLNYFILGKKNVEGFTYREFINDIKENYVYETQEYGIFYAADDTFDHIEEFYWQQKNKNPFCQITVNINECIRVQGVNEVNYIKVIGKNPYNLVRDLKEKFGIKEIAEWEEDMPKILQTKLGFGGWDFRLEKFHVSEYWFYYLYEYRPKAHHHKEN